MNARILKTTNENYLNDSSILEITCYLIVIVLHNVTSLLTESFLKRIIGIKIFGERRQMFVRSTNNYLKCIGCYISNEVYYVEPEYPNRFWINVHFFLQICAL